VDSERHVTAGAGLIATYGFGELLPSWKDIDASTGGPAWLKTTGIVQHMNTVAAASSD